MCSTRASNTTAGAAVLPNPTWRRLGRACKRGRNLDGGFLPKAATPKRTGRALRNSQFAIRNCHGSFPVFILGWTIRLDELRLSQNKFAELLGISVKTLHNREQGRRKPTGAARLLLRVASRHPEVVLEEAMA